VEIIAPTITATVLLSPGQSLATLTRVVNETAEVQMADGRSYNYEGASGGAPPSHSAADGTCDVSLEAMSATETGL
jgi:hypothetical protein